MSEQCELCYYCGQIADTVDHVIPRHLLVRAGAAGIDLSRVMRMRLTIVPACRECNCLIGGAVFRTIPERVKFLKGKLRKRYGPYLRIPRWTEEQLEEMGPNAQRDIRAALRVQVGARQRINWSPAVCAADVSAVYDLFRKYLGDVNESDPIEEAQ